LGLHITKEGMLNFNLMKWILKYTRTVCLSNRLKATFKCSLSSGLPYKEGTRMITTRVRFKDLSTGKYFSLKILNGDLDNTSLIDNLVKARGHQSYIRLPQKRLNRKDFRIMLDILRSDKNPMVQYRPKKDWRE